MTSPSGLSVIHAKFTQLVGYLQGMADALVRGCEAWNMPGHGNYKNEFGAGAIARQNF